MGKTKLVHKLVETLSIVVIACILIGLENVDSFPLAIHYGSSDTSETGEPYHIWKTVFQNVFQIKSTDSPSEVPV